MKKSKKAVKVASKASTKSVFMDRDDGLRLAALSFILLVAAIYFLSGAWGQGPSVLGVSIGPFSRAFGH